MVCWRCARYCPGRTAGLEGTGNLPALLGRNLTTSVATVFQDASCDGDTFRTVSQGAFVPVTARFRSVVFS
ncbi:hypothetical protein K7B10_00230 [Streptomyces flavotricini]|uniref:Uncharacterized protein n=1 Tax=Streptomyces flavotricini TaxID=66888 RepID=A0ABS8DWT1_9ACTN|nr:hypothetical protein [Streptomyces flavotricini]MCC0093261.1 hypothetical protein [Streptomyces flavotricini]